MGLLNEKAIARFWSKVDKRGPGECWPWKASTGRYGYGTFRLGTRAEAPRGAHRVAWELSHGPLPEGGGYHGTCVLHRCDNPPCCNPAHLFLGTQADNMRDRNAKGRSRLAKLTAADVTSIRESSEASRVLALRYGVHVSTISRIKTGTRWK